MSLDNFEELNNTKYEVYHRDISCLRHNLWQLLSRLKHSMIKSEISMSDLSNPWIFESGNIDDARGENNASWKVDYRNRYCLNDISHNFYFDYKAVQFDYKTVFNFKWK